MKPTTKGNYVGTLLPEGFSRTFAIRAAERGQSKAALLRDIAIDFLEKEPSTRKPRTQKEAAA